MESQLDISRQPFGLGGGMLLDGSVTIDVEGYCYYPLSGSSAALTLNNIDNGSTISATFIAGIPVFGHITAVTQSAGLAIIYYGAPDQTRY